MEISLFVIVCLSGLLGLISFWFWVTVRALKQKNEKLHSQLTYAESGLSRVHEPLSQSDKKSQKNQDPHLFSQANPSNQNSSNELLESRRESVRSRDEVKRLKEDLRIKEKELKQFDSLHIDKLYLLTNEKNSYLSQLKEMDKQMKAQADEHKKQIESFMTLKVSLEDQNQILDKRAKANISKNISLQEKLRFAEQEIQSHVKNSKFSNEKDQSFVAQNLTAQKEAAQKEAAQKEAAQNVATQNVIVHSIVLQDVVVQDVGVQDVLVDLSVQNPQMSHTHTENADIRV